MMGVLIYCYNSLMQQLQSYMISGLLFIIPVWMVYVMIKGIAGLVTALVSIHTLVAFGLALIIITLVGFLVLQVFKRYFKKHVLRWSTKQNLLGFIARIISQLDSIGDKAQEAFHNPVIYQTGNGIYKLAFVTDQDIKMLDDQNNPTPPLDAVWVYAPFPITMLGELMLVERKNITLLSPEQRDTIPLFIMTAGLIEYPSKHST